MVYGEMGFDELGRRGTTQLHAGFREQPVMEIGMFNLGFNSYNLRISCWEPLCYDSTRIL